MTHLRIEQNSNNEAVSSTLVHRLYTEAHTGLDSTSNLAGMITVSHCKQSEKNYLQSIYPNLNINCSEGYYMDFADPEVERICCEYWGDGIGVTQSQASGATGNAGSKFTGNTYITSFDEYKHFGFNSFWWGWSNPGGTFDGCTNLTTIDLGTIDKCCERKLFCDCSSLVIVKGNGLRTNGGYQCTDWSFAGCSNLETIDLSRFTKLGEGVFSGCKKLNLANNGFRWSNITTMNQGGSQSLDYVLGVGDIDLSNVTANNSYIQNLCRNCPSVTSIKLGPKFTGLGSYNNNWTASMHTCPLLRVVDFSDATATKWRRMSIGSGLPALEIIKLPSTITAIDKGCLGQSTVKALVLNSTTPPTITVDGNPNDWSITDGTSRYPQLKIYVPDAVVNDYKTTSPWDNCASIIYSHSQYAIDWPND